MTWYTHLSQVPKGFEIIIIQNYDINIIGLSYYIAHEFLDALPVHQFKVYHILLYITL